LPKTCKQGLRVSAAELAVPVRCDLFNGAEDDAVELIQAICEEGMRIVRSGSSIRANLRRSDGLKPAQEVIAAKVIERGNARFYQLKKKRQRAGNPSARLLILLKGR